MPNWTPEQSAALYNLPNWSDGYFAISDEGNVCATPNGRAGGKAGADAAPSIDVHKLLSELRRRGIQTPLLMRFDGVLRSRVREIHGAFLAKIKEYEYPAAYQPVFPIKVNQQRHVVETLLEEGQNIGMGLEVGSKPELLAALVLKNRDGMMLVCNGYKDREYIETALLAQRLGFCVVVVIEKFTELQTLLDSSKRLNIRPRIGVRTKLWGKGSGRWMESGGDRSKFGLTTRQVVSLVERLESEQMLDCFELLHFHIGSQITDIRSVKNAMREATRTLTGLAKLGVQIRYFDVGGGLAVDYDGSKTNFDSSMNYSLAEYADDVVYHLMEACNEAEIPHPIIVTESGRALTAHHAMLVTEVLGLSEYNEVGAPLKPAEDEHELIQNLAESYENLNEKNYLATYHDALEFRDEAMLNFSVGQLDLKERARVEEYFWRICRRVLEITRELDYIPDDLENLERDLADTYFLNFSLFQSLPDSWAIQQLFPILPLHRLNEEPKRRGVIADITCDSDGKIDHFINLRGTKRTLELHDLKPGEPYHLGIFLVGAYQEILGDMHNLFGDPNIVHVDVDSSGRPKLTHVVRGDRTEEVLSYVEYFEGDLLNRLRHQIETAIESGRMSFEESALLQQRYEAGLASYTYLASPEASPESTQVKASGDTGAGSPAATLQDLGGSDIHSSPTGNPSATTPS